MLINLLPDFFAVLNSTDRIAAYQRYFDNHRSILQAYWANYVLDPDGPHFSDVARSAALAGRAHRHVRSLRRFSLFGQRVMRQSRCADGLEVLASTDGLLEMRNRERPRREVLW